MGRPVVLAGVAQQASAGGGQADGVDKVFQDAVLHIGEGAVEQRLLQEQTHQRGLEALVSQLPQGLQDAGDPQVVVLGPKNSKEKLEASGKTWNVCVEVELLIKVSEALLPVWRPSNISTFIQQFDAVEIQHQGIGHKESPLRFPSALEFLLGFKHGISQDPRRCWGVRSVCEDVNSISALCV